MAAQTGLAGPASSSDLLMGLPFDSATPEELCGRVNDMLQRIWPQIRQILIEKGCAKIKEMIKFELGRQKDWTITDMQVEFDPGPTPPTLKGVRAFKKEHEEQHSFEDVDVEWNAGDDFQLKPNLKVNIKGVQVDTSDWLLSGLEFSAACLLMLAPSEKESSLGCAQLIFYDLPSMKIHWAVKSGPGFLDRLFATAMERIAIRMVKEIFMLHRMMVQVGQSPLADNFQMASMKSSTPIGLLEIEIMKAENLVAAYELTGKATLDAYVEINVGPGKMRSCTVANSVNPQWSDGLEYLLVYNLSNMVRLDVCDDDDMSADNLIGFLPGYNVYRLCREAQGLEDGTWFDLLGPASTEENKKNAGRIKLRVRYLELQDIEKGEQLLMLSSGPGMVQEAEPPWPPTPHMVSVRPLGLKGEFASGFAGAECTVEFSEFPLSTMLQIYADPSVKIEEEEEERGKREEKEKEEKKKGERLLPWGKKKSLMQRALDDVRGRQTAVLKVQHRFGFGPPEHGLPNKQQSEKARLADGATKEAEMVAQDLRTSFGIVWDEALHFVADKEDDPFQGHVHVTVLVGPESRPAITEEAQSLVGDGGVIGELRLELGHPPLPGDHPWKRRVQARLRRKKVDPSVQARGSEFGHEHLHGEDQCDESLGDVIPGILIEFLVEVRATKIADVPIQEGRSKEKVPNARKKIFDLVVGRSRA